MSDVFVVVVPREEQTDIRAFVREEEAQQFADSMQNDGAEMKRVSVEGATDQSADGDGGASTDGADAQ